MNEQEIESMVQANNCTAPRLAPEDLTANIVDTEFVTHVSKGGQVLCWAVLTTQSGFAVTGRPSVSVSQENDREVVGRQVAYDNARNELWALMGYALKERLHNAAVAQQKPAPGAATEGYASMLPHQQRVCDEQAEVSDKLNKLVAFRGTKLFESLPSDERERMVMQRQAMTVYNLVLCKRIAAFKKGGA